MSNDTAHVKSVPAWWHPVVELVVHVLVGSALFAIIFAPAVALDLLIHWLQERLHISEFLVSLLTNTKYVIASIDAVLYTIFVLRMGWLFVKTLFSIR